MESTCSVDRDDERIYNKMQYGGIYVSALFNCIVCFGDCFYDAGRTHLHRGHPKHKKPAVSLERKLNYKGEERLLAKEWYEHLCRPQ